MGRQNLIKTDWNTMPNLSELTLVVPTYNRQHHALRQMHFWSNSPVILQILDGTSVPINTKALKGFGNNVHYHHMPCSYEERVGMAVELVDTPYAALLCDDEFFIPSALEKCIEYLKNNKDFVACTGQWLGFHCLKQKIGAKQTHPEMKRYRVEKETTRERMVTHMNPYVQSIMYAVIRSEVLKNSMKILAKYSRSCKYTDIGEFHFELSACYQGKSIVIDELMMLKNYEVVAVRFEGCKKPVPLSEWLKEDQYADEVKNFFEITATEYAKIDGADKEEVLGSLKLSIAAVDKFLADKEQRRNYFKSKVIPKAIPFIPKKLRTEIKMTIRNFLWKPIMDEADILQKEGVNVDIKQLQEIIKYMERKGNEYSG